MTTKGSSQSPVASNGNYYGNSYGYGNSGAAFKAGLRTTATTATTANGNDNHS